VNEPGGSDVGPATSGDAAPPRRAVLEEVYRHDYRRLVAMAYGLSGSRAAAEELVQEAFLAAHRRWDEIGAYDEPAAWLRRVVVNRAVSVVRRRVAEGLALARLGARRQLPEVLPEQDEEVWRAVRVLPRRQAQVVALHYVDDMAVAEIATVLGCAEGTVKAHLHQARRSLARTLGHGLEDADDGPADPATPPRPAASDRPARAAVPIDAAEAGATANPTARTTEEVDR
jgi:RNA polymerase sigma-70 factor (ECF subfamily)